MLPCEEFNPVTRTKHNNNRAALAVIEELGYAAFAIMGEGFFRMNLADFSQPRGDLKDFLLVPREKISPEVLFLALENVGEIFSA